ncbi:tumor necrosis factor alpha-induced protein 8-like protein 1 isoform X2 [Symsagittifera roscoffensis]|uniref:tumor necrosis factor alpha-induced protein 8-like protein 1 isoform X2 n=1 Tax=Symsagittifera roscoffensis TaxID=84072 RepID=UPI00307BD936
MSDKNKNHNSKSLVVSAQKKVLSQLSANKSVQKQFLDEEQNRLLQLFHDLSYEYLCIQQNVSSIENKKEREKEEANVKQTVHKVHKDLIKLTVKISVLAGQKQLTGEELDALMQLREVFHKFVMTFVTYNQMPDCYNRTIILDQLAGMKDTLNNIISRPLSEKSGLRLDNVFNFFMDPKYLDAIFNRATQHKIIMEQICEILQNLLTNKLI